MSERNTRTEFQEFIYNKEDGTPTYCKVRRIKEVTYKFWIPAIHNWFWPCSTDQDRLHKMFIGAEQLTLDTSPIKLERSWEDTTPDDVPPVEERPPTEEEQNTLEWYG